MLCRFSGTPQDSQNTLLFCEHCLWEGIKYSLAMGAPCPSPDSSPNLKARCSGLACFFLDHALSLYFLANC